MTSRGCVILKKERAGGKEKRKEKEGMKEGRKGEGKGEKGRVAVIEAILGCLQ